MRGELPASETDGNRPEPARESLRFAGANTEKAEETLKETGKRACFFPKRV
jgi:hypothetical protein